MHDRRLKTERTDYALGAGLVLVIIGCGWWSGGADGVALAVAVLLAPFLPILILVVPGLLFLVPILGVAALFPAGRAWIARTFDGRKG